MAKKSAGILLYRFTKGALDVLLVHPGGPFWAKKDEGAWTIPKGEFEDNETPLDAAKREFQEEMGAAISGIFMPLEPVKLSSGKLVYAFALEHDFDTSQIKSNTFTMEWPPKSGKQQEFPEIDHGAWFDIETAKIKLSKNLVVMVEELVLKVQG